MVSYEYLDKIFSAAIQNYWFPYVSLGHMGHDPYGSQSTGNGSHHWYFYTLQILGCVPRTQVASSWWVPFEINVHMMQDVAISESLVQVKHALLCEYAYALK